MKLADINKSNRMEVESNLLHHNKQDDEKQPWRRKTLPVVAPRKNLLINVCQSSSIFIFLIIIATIPILQVFMGWYFFNACPINKLIPHFSIVAGMVSLLLVIMVSITQFITRALGRSIIDDPVDKANPNRATMLVGCGICSIMCINLSLFIFLLGWSVAGLIWVIEVWHRVQYRHAESSNYCHPVFYQFTMSLLLITLVFKILFFCFVCRKTCAKLTMARRRDTISSEDA